jgi:hypothetical protein
MGRIKDVFFSWHELFVHGYLQAQAEGQLVNLLIKARVTGDVINMLMPNKQNVRLTRDEMMEALRSDTRLSGNIELANQSLRTRFRSLSYIPIALTWILNIGISVLYLNWQRIHVDILLANSLQWQEIKSLLPWIIFTLGTLIFGRSFGMKLMKPFVTVVLWGIKAYRWLTNRKVEEQ